MTTLTKKAITDLKKWEKLFIKHKSEYLKDYHVVIEMTDPICGLTKYHTQSKLELFYCSMHLRNMFDEKAEIGFSTLSDYKNEDFIYSEYEIINEPQ